LFIYAENSNISYGWQNFGSVLEHCRLRYIEAKGNWIIIFVSRTVLCLLSGMYWFYERLECMFNDWITDHLMTKQLWTLALFFVSLCKVAWDFQIYSSWCLSSWKYFSIWCNMFKHSYEILFNKYFISSSKPVAEDLTNGHLELQFII
jgi:hypothetical protein